jgi:alpha-ribazole phosphatase
MTKHYLIRHTPPDVKKGVCYGQSDLDLRGNTDFYFETVRKNLPKSSLPIFSSPLRRCSDLGEFLNQKNLTLDPRLKEIDFGDWELKEWDSIPKEEISPWYADYLNISPPKGESFNQLLDRVEQFYEDTLLNLKESSIIISHHGPLRIMLGLNRGMELKDIFDLKLSFGEVVELEL